MLSYLLQLSQFNIHRYTPIIHISCIDTHTYIYIHIHIVDCPAWLILYSVCLLLHRSCMLNHSVNLCALATFMDHPSVLLFTVARVLRGYERWEEQEWIWEQMRRRLSHEHVYKLSWSLRGFLSLLLEHTSD